MELVRQTDKNHVSDAAKIIATANLTEAQAKKFELDIQDLEVLNFVNVVFDYLPDDTVDVFIIGNGLGRDLFVASMKDGMLAHYGWSQPVLESQIQQGDVNGCNRN